MLLSNQKQIKEQAEFSYSWEKASEKQMKKQLKIKEKNK